MNFEMFKKLKLPDKPGVYFFKKGRDILYIGKATSLRNRIKSYFGKNLINTRGPTLVDMIFQSDNIKWQETDSVLEALILEAVLIKKYQPKYNTKEKSDKSFNYVCITKNHLRYSVDGLPKVIIVRGKNLKLEPFSKIFGPYPNGSQLKEAVKIIRRIFPFLDEKNKNYVEFYRQINLVPDLNDRKLYLQNIKNIILFFSGKKQKILKNLKKEMIVYAKKREFEKAGEVKRQIFALQHINDVALLKNESYAGGKIFRPAPFFGRIKGNKVGPSDRKILPPAPPYDSNLRIEAYDIAHMSGKNMVGVMVALENGEVAKNEYRKFKIKTQKDSNDTGALKEILTRRFTHREWRMPDLMVVDGGMAQMSVVKKVLAKIPRFNFGIDASVVAVIKDERHKPKEILGDKKIIMQHKSAILLANSEAHRFAIYYHKNLRAKNFLK